MDYEKLMRKARKTNKERDVIDGMPHANHSIDLQLRTCMCAIQSGIACMLKQNPRIAGPDLDCIAEAQGMLEDLHEKITGKRYQA